MNGGIRGAPKFPQPQFFQFLWRAGLRFGLPHPLEAVDLTLTQIAQGGIYDHLGGGFARYSVDEKWLVPHFEKMLYDNAQLVEMMTQAWREKKSPLYAQRIEETIGWLLREMTVEGGGFASSLDADSEGEEGKFYVWSLAEIEDALGAEDAKLFAEIYGVTRDGNFEGHNILNRLGSIELRDAETEARLAAMRDKLLERRALRVRPGFDDKVLADWNGLMIAALANAADAFDRADWLEAAERAFDFVCTRMTVGRAAAARLSQRRGQGAGDRQRLRQHDQGGTRARERHRQARTMSSARRRGPKCSTALLVGESRRLLFHRRRHHRSHRAAVQRTGRGDAERERHDGVEFGGAQSVDRRGALSPTRRRDPARLRRRHDRQRAGACRAAGRRARCDGAGA